MLCDVFALGYGFLAAKAASCTCWLPLVPEIGDLRALALHPPNRAHERMRGKQILIKGLLWPCANCKAHAASGGLSFNQQKGADFVRGSDNRDLDDGVISDGAADAVSLIVFNVSQVVSLGQSGLRWLHGECGLRHRLFGVVTEEQTKQHEHGERKAGHTHQNLG